MHEYFHCSHDPNLKNGSVFGLFPNVMYHPRPNPDYSIKDAYKKYDELFPDSISNHGINHLSFHPVIVNNTSYYAEKNVTEHLFETIRQREYSNCPSRFMSYFGCLTLESAKELIQNFLATPRSIYRVSCREAFIADMELIKLGESIPGTFLLAEKYWSQQASANPLWEALMKPPITILEKIQ